MSWIKKSALWWGFGGAAAMACVVAGTWQGCALHQYDRVLFIVPCNARRWRGISQQYAFS
nr:cytochrome c-type protein [Salmonella sp. NCTC 7297]